MAKPKSSSRCFDPFSIAPLTGPLDARSEPGMVSPVSFRYRLNFEAPGTGSLCRATGWTRLLSGNSDFHDPLLSLSPGAVVEPITTLFEARTRPGQSRLYLGTDTRLAALNASTNNYQIVSDNLAPGGFASGTCNGPGWSRALVNRTAVLTNGLDGGIVSHVIGQPAEEGSDQAVRAIADLETLGVTRALFVIAWRGLVLLCNVVQDGAHVDHRVWWSDLNRPLSYLPKLGISAASSQDLGSGETLLNAAPLGNSLILYTATGIWIVDLIGLPNTLSFTKRYSHPQGKRCLAHRRALASSGDRHFYLSRDNICVFDLYSPEPETPEWLDAAAPIIFQNISDNCNAACAGFDSSSTQPQSQQQSGTLWFSWARADETCNSQSLRIQPDERFVSLVDHGFTAFTNFTADEPITMRGWILDNCICSVQGMEDAGWGFINEAPPCGGMPTQNCTSFPARLYTSTTKFVDGWEVEDMDAPTASSDSLCALLAGRFGADFCPEDFAGQACSTTQLFLAVSAQDNCIKSLGNVYFRQRCISTAGCGAYVLDGYSSILRSGPISLGKPYVPKGWNRLLIDMMPADQTIPSKIRLRTGTSLQPVDPNIVGCGVIWLESIPKDMKCLALPEAKQLMDNVRQGNPFQWPLYREGQWLYYELRIDETGGSTCLARVELMLALMNKC